MTRRNIWAMTVLLALCSQLLIAHLLWDLQPPLDESYLHDLKLGVYLGSGVCLLGIIGWAYEASKPGIGRT